MIESEGKLLNSDALVFSPNITDKNDFHKKWAANSNVLDESNIK